MSRTRARPRVAGAVVAGAVLAGAVLLGGCGVTAQDRPVRIDRREVPFGLLRETPPSTRADTATIEAP